MAELGCAWIAFRNHSINIPSILTIIQIVMVSFFYFVVNRGVTWLMALVFLLQLKCFSEIITIGLAVYRLYDLPWFRALSW